MRAEDATDATSAALAIRRPVNVLAPSISGEPRMSRTLTCARGDWDDTAGDRYAVTYQWLRANVVIPGATTPTLTLGRDDVARAMSCRVRAEDATDATSATVTTLAPQALLRPMLSGQPHLRGELSCTRGTWDDTPEQRYAVSYQWYRSGAPINGATNPAYVVGTADLGRSLSCSATAEVLSESFATAVTVATPSETVLPRIEGIAHPRRDLTCGRGEWNDSPGKRYITSYKWRRNGVAIPDADGPDHIVTAADVGTSLTCAVTAEGTRTAVSPAVVPTWEALRLSMLPDSDAGAPGAFNAYTARLRNENPVAVTITQFDLTLPGGFSFRPSTTSGALTIDPTQTGTGSLLLRWTQDFVVPAQGEAVLRIGVTSANVLGDHLATARAYPTSSAFTIPIADRIARITIEGAEPAAGACTIVGTDGPDVLAGTAGSDVICGFGGDDVLRGLGGDDELWGGAGDDRLDGGEGADAVRGGEGADVLDGGLGADILRGGGDLDTMLYTTRSAPVSVTVGVTNGDDGEDEEGDTVGSDIEIVRGGQGNDTLVGGLGPEELYGRGGDDTLDGGPGAADLLDGGDGADSLDRPGRGHRSIGLRRRRGPLRRRHPRPRDRLRDALRERAPALMRTLLAAALLAATIAPVAHAAKPARPDLSISKSAANPRQATPGAELTITWTVKNGGAKPAGKSTTELVLSTDAKLDKKDIKLASITEKAIKARKTAVHTLKAKVPASTAVRRYTLLVCADTKAKVAESGETNNCRAAGAIEVVAAKASPAPAPQPPAAVPTAAAAGPTAEPTAPAPPALQTTITEAPASSSPLQAARFSFTANRPGASFECRLDDQAFTACASPKIYSDILAGFHVFEVRAALPSGEREASAARHSWRIAFEAPAVGPTENAAPAPEARATTADQGEMTLVGDTTEFLYKGADPIQKQVETDAIEPARASVLRGKAVRRNGTPIEGVRVTVVDHPELGHTATRTDGGFEIAVNGGDTVALAFEREGYVPVAALARGPHPGVRARRRDRARPLRRPGHGRRSRQLTG